MVTKSNLSTLISPIYRPFWFSNKYGYDRKEREYQRKQGQPHMPAVKTTPLSSPYLPCIIFFLVLALTACNSSNFIPTTNTKSSDFTLIANAGKFHSVDIGKPTKSTNIDVNITLTDLNNGTKWRPSAYIGIRQIESLENSFQFFMLQNENEDNYAIAGYRIFENGEELEQVSISHINIGKSVRVRLSIDDGLVTLILNEKAPVVKQTSLKEVNLYASVSSGSALFELHEVGSEPIR